MRISNLIASYSRFALTALCLFVASSSVFGQQPVNHERGLSANSYLSTSFDQVNLYNGNLTLTIPVGPTFTVGGNLKYRLTLVYNSTTWNYKTELQPGVGPDGTAEMRTQSESNPKANAGHGWAVTLGALYPPKTGFYNTNEFDYLYVAPDGSEHRFINGGMTQDGTYLRLNVAERRVDFPDGTRHYFNANNYQLSRMEDSFGNQVTLNTSNASVWVIQDKCTSCAGTTRTHRIYFNLEGETPRISSIALSAFDNPGQSGTTSDYTFDYGDAPVNIHRYRDNWYRSNETQAFVNIWMLRSVTLPAGAGSYQFAYTNFDGSASYNGPADPTLITATTSPTGGHYKWDWTLYQRPFVRPEDPAQLCQPYCPDTIDPVSSSDGIYRKRIYNRSTDANPIGTYEYDSLGGHRPTYSDLKGDAIVTVKSPAGDDTVSYFNLDFTPDTSGPSEFYGLPFTPRQTIQAGGQTLYLSQEFYKGSGASRTKVRSVYIRYEVDGMYDTGAPSNARVAAQRIIYHDDNGRYADTFNTDWNGLGKYRQTQTGGNFTSGNVRTTNVNYSGLVPAAGSPWVLNLYTQQKVTEGSQTAYTQFCFDQTTGALKQKRTLKDGGSTPLPTGRDIFVVYGRDANGNGSVTSEKFYGGDKSQNAPTGDVCTAPGVAPEYELAHTYSYGALATSRYVGLGADEFYTVNNVIDQRTGFIGQSSDASGVITAYEYDTLGRIKKVKPAEDAHTEYSYTAASGAANAIVQIDRQRPNGPLMSRSKLEADPFGRVALEQDSVPDNNGALTPRKTEYNAMGWVTSVSEFGSTGQKTTYSDFDSFGRSQWVTAADGKVTRAIYTGASYVERRRGVGTAVDAAGVVSETSANVDEYYDRQGRLISVIEGSGINNARVQTSYQYDVGGRLKQSSTGGAVTQPRANVALAANGAVAYASSTLDSRFPVSAIINGDRQGIGWEAGTGGWHDATYNTFPDYLEIHFSGEKQINEIDFFTLQDNYPSPSVPTADMTFTQWGVTAFRLNYWDTATNQWVFLAEIQGNNKVWRKVDFPTVRTPKLSIMILNGASSYSRVVEIEAWEAQQTTTTNVTQTRTFTYDNRGFLMSEAHPEITSSVTYKYNSLGMATEKIEGNHKLVYAYDKAGRILSVTDGYAGQELKTYSYYGVNSPLKSLGKMRKASRTNWVRNPYVSNPSVTEVPVKISEEYTYGGLGGRLDTRKTTLADGGATPYIFTQTFNYDTLGNMTSQSYPECLNSTCINSNVRLPRTVTYDYELGYLKKVGVPGNPGAYAPSITYFGNKMLGGVSHSNGVTDTYAKDPNNIARIRRITFAKTDPVNDPRGGVINWTSGLYEYDGAGNITEIGTDWFIYDHANRIREGTAGTDAQGNRYKQSYAYDPMGNMTQRTTTKNGFTDIVTMTVDSSTNRLGGIQYDAAGNALGVGRTDVYVFDPLNMTKKTPGKTYLYGPTDERVWSIDKGYNDLTTAPAPLPPIVETITLRGLGNEVLREYQVTGGNADGHWRWMRDNIYRGGALLAAETLQYGRRNYHLDHLGSARFVTNSQGAVTDSMAYYPYGMEAQGFNSDQLRFTGQERDVNYPPGHTLYYMHARYYGQDQGKFFSVDPDHDFDPRQPQSWNLYAYVRNNPVNRTDPTGRFTVTGWLQQVFRHAPAADGQGSEVSDQTPSVVQDAEMLDYAIANQQIDTKVPQSGFGFYSYANPGAAGYGRPWVVNHLTTFAGIWRESGGAPIGIGDISWAGGGSMQPLHKGHTDGQKVDVRPMRVDGKPLPTNINDPNYSRAETARLIQSLSQVPGVKGIIFNDRSIPGLQHDRPGVHTHDNHLHVIFSEPF
jgi:RHS repeat-associated protein